MTADLPAFVAAAWSHVPEGWTLHPPEREGSCAWIGRPPVPCLRHLSIDDAPAPSVGASTRMIRVDRYVSWGWVEKGSDTMLGYYVERMCALVLETEISHVDAFLRSVEPEVNARVWAHDEALEERVRAAEEALEVRLAFVVMTDGLSDLGQAAGRAAETTQEMGVAFLELGAADPDLAYAEVAKKQREAVWSTFGAPAHLLGPGGVS